jgi:hypothetical protein
MTNIVYPLIKSDWEEIKYSLRSLALYFKDSEYKVYILGDYKPEWLVNAEYIFMERKPLRHADTGQKLKWCSENLKDFIWVNDDLYFLKPVTSDYIKQIKAASVFAPNVHKGSNEWTEMMYRTYAALQERYPNRTLYNFITHAPRYFDSQKLAKAGGLFPDIWTGFLSAVTVYCNLSWKTPPSLINDIAYAVDGVIKNTHYYLNHNDATLSERVKRYIYTRFDTICKFESGFEIDDYTPMTDEIKENECIIQYLGRTPNYSIYGYKFKNKTAIMPKKLAQKLVSENPKTFIIG